MNNFEKIDDIIASNNIIIIPIPTDMIRNNRIVSRNDLLISPTCFSKRYKMAEVKIKKSSIQPKKGMSGIISNGSNTYKRLPATIVQGYIFFFISCFKNRSLISRSVFL